MVTENGWDQVVHLVDMEVCIYNYCLMSITSPDIIKRRLGFSSADFSTVRLTKSRKEWQQLHFIEASTCFWCCGEGCKGTEVE